MKIKNQWVMVGLVILTFAAGRAQAEKTAGDLFKEAQLQETTVRDLDAAARLYRAYLEQPGTDRPTQADAQLHLGLCLSKLGLAEDAKATWNKVIQDYSDQTTAYQEAKRMLLETEKIVAAASSTPTVKVVYAIPRTRFEFRLPGFLVNVGINQVFLSYPAVAYFYKANRALELEGSVIESRAAVSHGIDDASRDTTYFGLIHRWEKNVGNQIHPYLKLGPAAYQFELTGSQEYVRKWAPGLMAEAGLTFGWPRGFVFTFGYALNAFYQPSLGDVIGSSFRGVDSARVSLGYRW